MVFLPGWEILREAMDTAGRPVTPVWVPPPEARGAGNHRKITEICG